MLAEVMSLGLVGAEGYQVRVEVDVSPGIPAFETVGLPGAAVRESRERVRASIRNCRLTFAQDRITVNLSPADTKKEGPLYDLPIALALLAATGQIPPRALEGLIVMGELSLTGDILPVRGMLAMCIAARRAGHTRLVVPEKNAAEAGFVSGLEVLPASRLDELVAHLRGEAAITPYIGRPYAPDAGAPQHDLCVVKGQAAAKRALEIAAAGAHNVLLIGPPGSGKTLLARCMPGILPDLSLEEALEVTQIHCLSQPVEGGLISSRPFRIPGQNISSPSMLGGGTTAMPGEVSKAHHGVLFLDEMPQFPASVLESLRQPMEDGDIAVVRMGAQVTYPARFMLICAMNPCPCGYYGSAERRCRCTEHEIRKYLSRISQPLLDRIDMHIEMESIPAELLRLDDEEEGSLAVKARVNAARAVQQKRYEGLGLFANAQLQPRLLQKHCKLSDETHALLARACTAQGMSNRAYTRLVKLARTIADLEGAADILPHHAAEAIQYRVLDRKYWGRT